jgi:hypothetical protein
MKSTPIRPTFEDSIQIINSEIAKKRSRWTLYSLGWLDFDDVAQCLRLHIFKKWEKFDCAKPLAPWLNVIISNQIKNLIRNLYTNYARPCLRCAAARDLESCDIYGIQCSDCPLFAYWRERKESATQIKIPVSIENHPHEVSQICDDTSDVYRHIDTFHAKMKEVLTTTEYRVYKILFINHQEEKVAAKKIGLISNEKGRPSGYKQIKNIKKTILIKAHKLLDDGEIDLF